MNTVTKTTLEFPTKIEERLQAPDIETKDQAIACLWGIEAYMFKNISMRNNSVYNLTWFDIEGIIMKNHLPSQLYPAFLEKESRKQLAEKDKIIRKLKFLNWTFASGSIGIALGAILKACLG